MNDQTRTPTEAGMVLNKLKAQLSQLESFSLSRQALFSKLTGTGRRDYDNECDYPSTVSTDQLFQSYEREGLGKRIVTIYPEESWKQAPIVFETEDQDETEFEAALEDLILQHNLWHRLRQVDELSGIGRFGILLLGLSDGLNLDQPVTLREIPKPKKKGEQGKGELTPTPPKDPRLSSPAPKKSLELLYIRAFDERAVVVDQREMDPRNPRFGQPTMYSVTFQDDTYASKQQGQGQSLGASTSGLPGQSQQQTVKVHWTRVIHIADNRTRSEVYGDPRQQVCYNRLVDAKKVCGGGSEMFWKGGYPGLSVEAMPGVSEFESDDESLKQQFRDYESGLQRFLALIGVSVKPLVVPVADPTPQYEMLVTDVCVALGVPKRIFMGSERGELASSQDQTAWNSRLLRRCEEYLSPLVIRPLIDRLIQIGVLPVPPEGYKVEWADLNAATDDEKADIALKMSQSIQAYLNAGGESLMPPRLFLTLVLKLSEAEAEQIAQEMDNWAGGFEDPNADPKGTPPPAPGAE